MAFVGYALAGFVLGADMAAHLLRWVFQLAYRKAFVLSTSIARRADHGPGEYLAT